MKRVKRNVTEATKLEVYERDGECCVLCGRSDNLERTQHHCLYGYDAIADESRNTARQLVTISRDCHHEIHCTDDKDNKRDKCIQYLFDLYGEEFYRSRGFIRQLITNYD